MEDGVGDKCPTVGAGAADGDEEVVGGDSSDGGCEGVVAGAGRRVVSELQASSENRAPAVAALKPSETI